MPSPVSKNTRRRVFIRDAKQRLRPRRRRLAIQLPCHADTSPSSVGTQSPHASGSRHRESTRAHDCRHYTGGRARYRCDGSDRRPGAPSSSCGSPLARLHISRICLPETQAFRRTVQASRHSGGALRRRCSLCHGPSCIPAEHACSSVSPRRTSQGSLLATLGATRYGTACSTGRGQNCAALTCQSTQRASSLHNADTSFLLSSAPPPTRTEGHFRLGIWFVLHSIAQTRMVDL